MSTSSQVQARRGWQQWHRQSAEEPISNQSPSEQVSSDAQSSREEKPLWGGFLHISMWLCRSASVPPVLYRGVPLV